MFFRGRTAPKERKRNAASKDYKVLTEDEEEEVLLPPRKPVFAKKKKPDSWKTLAFEVVTILLVGASLYYSYWYLDHIHFHITGFYAALGHPNAQHMLAHKYLEGVGTKQNHSLAFKWFRKAADQGHPHSSYNLAVGHMQGFHTDVEKGEARRLIRYAAVSGVEEAVDVYHRVCRSSKTKKNCDH